jgi:sugar/nucleoside kinase (ribokinase family)
LFPELFKIVDMEHNDIVRRALGNMQTFNSKKHLLIGFDGFVDEIIHVVDTRSSQDEYLRMKTITAFSERIASVAGLSANIELLPVQTKLGGNGPIMANAIIAQNHDVTYIGALGKEIIHPVFREFSETCKNVISLTDPGYTDALEFFDGKIMLGKMNNLQEVSFKNLLEKMTQKEIEQLLAQVDMIAFTNWTMLSNLNSIIREFSNLIGQLPKKPKVFLDLADPKKRTTEDIRQVLDLISAIPSDTILSMNLSESTIISLVLGIKEDEILNRAINIREKMGISGIVIHPVNGAAIAHEKSGLWMEGPYTPEPKLTTGAGDNFNSGFCNAWLADLEPGECLAMGVCASGFYVRNARSGTKQEILNFMKQWVDSRGDLGF